MVKRHYSLSATVVVASVVAASVVVASVVVASVVVAPVVVAVVVEVVVDGFVVVVPPVVGFVVVVVVEEVAVVVEVGAVVCFTLTRNRTVFPRERTVPLIGLLLSTLPASCVVINTSSICTLKPSASR